MVLQADNGRQTVFTITAHYSALVDDMNMYLTSPPDIQWRRRRRVVLMHTNENTADEFEEENRKQKASAWPRARGLSAAASQRLHWIGSYFENLT